MSDEPTSGEPQAGDPGTNPQPQAGTTSPEPQAGDGKDTISLEEAKKLRSEAANLRKRMKAYEDAEKAAQDAKQAAEEAERTELDRERKQRTDLQAKYEAEVKRRQEMSARHDIKDAASKLNFVYPDLAHKWLESSEFAYDDDGSLTNAEDLLKTLLKHYPDLEKKQAEPATTPAQTATPNQSAPPLPAMNVSSAGRQTIPVPGGNTPGRVPTWKEVFPRP